MTLGKDWHAPDGSLGESVVARIGDIYDTVEVSRRQRGLLEGQTARILYLTGEWREFTEAVKKGEYDV